MFVRTYEFTHSSQHPLNKIKLSTHLHPVDALKQYLKIYHEMVDTSGVSLFREADGIWSYKLGPQETIWAVEQI